MKVLMKQDIENVGRMGEVVKVAGGYARNYLMPHGFAVSVTRGNIKEIEQQRKILEARAQREREKNEGVADKVKGVKIVIKERCSATGKLFGSVTNRRITQEIEALTGLEIDRHKIQFDEKIREVGTYTAKVRLHPDVTFDIEFEVEGEGFHSEEPPDEVEDTETKEELPEVEATAEVEVVAEAPESEASEEKVEETADAGPAEDSAGGEGDEDTSQG